ncbi:MAG: hypothetical protein ACOYN0_12410 [Phycisphaerales bacterium]
MLRLCMTLVLALFASARVASAQTDTPATPQPRPKFEAKRVAIFAHYGDLNQQYEATPGSEDRRSSYELPEAAFLGAPGALADTDNPTARPDRCFPFVFSGYTPFDPRTLIAGSLRFDVFVNDFEQAPRWSLELLSSGGSHATMFHFGSGLRDALAASNQLRPQWLSLHLDLVTGELSAHEIDPFGRPIRGREYPMIAVDWQLSERRYAILPEARYAIQEAASEGSLCGIVAGGARTSFVSLNATALARGPAPLLQPRSIELRRGSQGPGSPSSLSQLDDNSLNLVPDEASGEYISEIRCAFVVHKGLLESASEDATIRIAGGISGAVPAEMIVDAVKPDSDELVPLGSHPFRTGFKEMSVREVHLPHWRQVVGANDRIVLQIRIVRPVVLGADTKLSTFFYKISNRPALALELCQLKFDIPPTEPMESPTSPASPVPAK